jgi:hypothetical protein
MKSQEIPKKEDMKDNRYSLGFDKKDKEKNNNPQQIQFSLKDSRAKSARPLLLRKYIPTLKPIKANMNPSVIYLNAGANSFISKKYKENLLKSKNDINIVAEEDYERNANSGDERYGFNKISYKKDNFLSSEDDNDIIENNDNPINEININNNINSINIKIPKKKKCVKNNIEHIRKLLIKTKEKMIIKKYNDDTSIITNNPYKNYFKENMGYILGENKKYFNNNDLVSNNSFDYGSDNNFQISKSKSIYVTSRKFRNKPPILGFLQMNENSANTTLSSGVSEI